MSLPEAIDGGSTNIKRSLSQGVEPDGNALELSEVAWPQALSNAPVMLTDLFARDIQGNLISNPTADPHTVARVVVAAMSDLVINSGDWGHYDSVPSSDDMNVFEYALELLQDSPMVTARGPNVSGAQVFWNNFRDTSLAIMRNRLLIGRASLIELELTAPYLPDSDFDPLDGAFAVAAHIKGDVCGNVAHFVRASTLVFDGNVSSTARIGNNSKGSKFTFNGSFKQPTKNPQSFQDAEDISVNFAGVADGVIGSLRGRSMVRRLEHSMKGQMRVAGTRSSVSLEGATYVPRYGLDLDYYNRWTRFQDRWFQP